MTRQLGTAAVDRLVSRSALALAVAVMTSLNDAEFFDLDVS